MSFKEITSLRKAGKLNEAFLLAQDSLAKKPNDEWLKKAAAWVYYAFMKKALESDNLSEIIVQIKNIKSLNLPDTEKMVFDSIAWIIGKYLFRNSDMEEKILNELFYLIKDFSFSKPAKSYTFLLKSFNKHATQWHNFILFTNWWGLDNFQQSDSEPPQQDI